MKKNFIDLFRVELFYKFQAEFRINYFQLTTATVCNMVADVAFMIDGSDTVGPENFLKVRSFVEKVVANLNVGDDPIEHSRVSVSVFSDSVVSGFSLKQYSSLFEYIAAIKNIKYPGGGSHSCHCRRV